VRKVCANQRSNCGGKVRAKILIQRGDNHRNLSPAGSKVWFGKNHSNSEDARRAKLLRNNLRGFTPLREWN